MCLFLKGYLTAVACLEIFRLKSDGPFAQMYLIKRRVCSMTSVRSALRQFVQLRKVQAQVSRHLLLDDWALVGQALVYILYQACRSLRARALYDLPDILQEVYCTKEKQASERLPEVPSTGFSDPKGLF